MVNNYITEIEKWESLIPKNWYLKENNFDSLNQQFNIIFIKDLPYSFIKIEKYWTENVDIDIILANNDKSDFYNIYYYHISNINDINKIFKNVLKIMKNLDNNKKPPKKYYRFSGYAHTGEEKGHNYK